MIILLTGASHTGKTALAQRLLEKYKFQITTLTSSIECIDRIKQEEQYDILFLDY